MSRYSDSLTTLLTVTVFIDYSDIDECLNASLNNCSQRCMNTMGSFYCYCDSGYEGSADCIGKSTYTSHMIV